MWSVTDSHSISPCQLTFFRLVNSSSQLSNFIANMVELPNGWPPFILTQISDKKWQEMNSKMSMFSLCCQEGDQYNVSLRAPRRLGPALTACVGMGVGTQTREPLQPLMMSSVTAFHITVCFRLYTHTLSLKGSHGDCERVKLDHRAEGLKAHTCEAIPVLISRVSQCVSVSKTMRVH